MNKIFTNINRISQFSNLAFLVNYHHEDIHLNDDELEINKVSEWYRDAKKLAVSKKERTSVRLNKMMELI